MVTEHIGDLLESGCDIICHQVNTFGVMGGSKEYLSYLKESFGDTLGEVIFVKNYIVNLHRTGICIANCFSQNEDGTTNYNAVEECFNQVKQYAYEQNYKTVGVPKNYDCGIAIGNWEKVQAILVNIFQDKDIELQIWEKK